MTIIEAYESGRKSEIPSSWDEMTQKQIRYVFKTYDTCLKRGLSPLEFNVLVMCHFLGLRHFRPGHLGNGRTAENIYMLCEKCLGYLFSKEGDGPVRLALDISRNPLPRIGLRLGPSELIMNLTFGEFRHAAMAVKAYASSNDVTDLDECIAILYRSPSLRANRAGRHVPGLDRPSFRWDIRKASRTPSWKKHLILTWFCHCLQYLQNGSLELDGEMVDLSLLFAADGSGRGPACTWNDLVVQLAKDGIIGNMDSVDEEPLPSVLKILWANYKEARRYEETAKAYKTR